MRIAIMVEGATEGAFMPAIRRLLVPKLANRMPLLDAVRYDGLLPKDHKLRREVQLLLSGRQAADHVIALTDVYTGGPDFADANDAKTKMRLWVGEEPRFHPHVALHEFEAWLLPYWSHIQQLAGSKRARPGADPESVNHGKPPSHHIADAFRTGARQRKYIKTRDALRILREADLTIAASECSELRAFLSTILILSGGAPL